ncbi:hypothetical protein C0993_006968 [Termitomyces sp. T159_Od127]|nr:hypothetical protein C0993_006968 [Termitomyces sp. T159_Od127]
MVAQKRTLEDSSSSHKFKKTRISDGQPSNNSFSTGLVAEEVDFPRGGGSSFTPVEVKAIRAEAVKEANEELFVEGESQQKATKKKKRKSEVQKLVEDKNDKIRIEHLNYKRMNIGMKILGQVVSIQPLALIVSLPNQLFAHVPLTNISTQLTALLEGAEESAEELSEDEEGDERISEPRIPTLSDLFHEGQYVRGVVTAVYAQGSTDHSVIAKSRDEMVKSSRRVELSLYPERINAGIQKADLKAGFTLSTAVKSIEDHGYILDLGLPDVSGFLTFKDAEQRSSTDERLHLGQLLDVTITKMSNNGRICNVVADRSIFTSSCLSEVTNASSVLPGTLVQSLITAISSSGLNLQILGFFDGTVDQFHLPHPVSEKAYKVGKKIKARVLYNYSSSPPRFALALAEHILALKPRREGELTLREAFPIGRILDGVKVTRLEAERGIVVEVQPETKGFVHISHVSEEHVPSLSSSGPWKIDTLHRARVIGYFPFDGLLQLSFKPSIIESKFLQIADVEVGEVVKGTIKKLTETGLFVTLSGSIDGVVWPNHYADITLKHPSKRFKIGASIKCRVLVVDTERNRISLTAKKTLLESTLPQISTFEDAKVGVITHAVVFKIREKHLLVEFFNNLKAIVPIKEASETPINKLADAFPVGRVVRVRIIGTEPEHSRIIASIRQASVNSQTVMADISTVEIGNIVQGTVSEIHKDNAVLSLQPTQVRALISLKNLANFRSLSVTQLCASLKTGDLLEDLVVVTRNTEKGFVIVASKPKAKEARGLKGPLSIDTVVVGQLVGGRVTLHTRNGTLIKLNSHIGGILHPTDTCDDYESGVPFPPIDTLIKAVVIGIDQSRKQLSLSTRHSKMYPDQVKPIVDREICDISDLHPGEMVRGFIKSVAEHGLFVTVGRGIDARVQIRELFDELSDNKDADVAVALQGFREGDCVKAVIQKVEKNKISLSLKPSNFVEEDFDDHDLPMDADVSRDGDTLGVIDNGVFQDAQRDDTGESSSEDDNDDTMDIDINPDAQVFKPADSKQPDLAPTLPVPSLKLTGGFQWSSTQPRTENEPDSGSSTDESDIEASSGKKKRRKRKEIEYDLTGDMHTKTPESNADFERFLLGSPNSSFLWIQYMSFQLQLSEIDKAREIARRAIQTISFREESERLNVWIALLNLENVYGTDETLENTFKDAAKSNDSKTVHLRLASILDEAGKLEKAEAQFKRTCKKFGRSSKVWTLFGEYYLRRGNLEEARKLLPRSLQSLDQRKHLKTISKFAQLEYKQGEPERGKTLFEGIIESHPKRWDLWAVYIDMEAGQGDIQSLRNLFDRVFALKMTSHKAKAFFKKWLELERKIGDEDGAQNVKQKAIEWTQRANAS